MKRMRSVILEDRERWLMMRQDVDEILFETEKWFGRDISVSVDLVRRKHAEIMAKTCPPELKVDVAEASKTKIDEDEENEEWVKVLAVAQKNVKAAFPGFLQEDTDGLEVGKSKEEESFDASMAAADATGQNESRAELQKVKEEQESFDRSMLDVDAFTSDMNDRKVEQPVTGNHKDAKAPAPVPDGVKSQEVVAASTATFHSPPATPVTKRRRKSSEVPDIETDAQKRDREPDASNVDGSMEDANGRKVGEAVVGSQAKGGAPHAKKEDDPTEDAEAGEQDKSQYSCTAI